MPRGDRTGPLGMGTMTGRRAGNCNGFAASSNTNRGECMGDFGSGYGNCHGHRRMFRATGMPGWMFDRNVTYEEKSYLERQCELLEWQLQGIKTRLNQLNEEA